MTHPRLDIISEQKSPLFRIMWVTNPLDLSRRQFDNNISAFHIGKGLVLTVAHNLRIENPFLKSIHESVFQQEILPQLHPSHQSLFKQSYILDTSTQTRHINVSNAAVVKSITEGFVSMKFDRRWITLSERNMSIPHLIIQFSDHSFYRDPELTKLFHEHNYFFEPSLNRHTYLLPLETVKAFYESDIALYKVTETHASIIEKLPFLDVDYSILDDSQQGVYCLQSSPAGFLGRLLNQAQIEGYLDQYQVFNDRVGGNYVLEGYRYLIKGYFRFGSSGAPYIIFDKDNNTYKVNAIQSEASPIQLSINNNREGNFQYVNAIASPLSLIEKELKAFMLNV